MAEPRPLPPDYEYLPPEPEVEFLSDAEVEAILAEQAKADDAYIAAHPEIKESAEVKLARVVVPPYMRVREGHVENVSGYTYNRRGGRLLGRIFPMKSGGPQQMGDLETMMNEALPLVHPRVAQFKEGDQVYILGHGPGVFHSASRNMEGQIRKVNVTWTNRYGSQVTGDVDAGWVVSPDAKVTPGFVQDLRYAKHKIRERDPARPGWLGDYTGEVEIIPRSVRYSVALQSSDGGLWIGGRRYKKVAEAKRAVSALLLPEAQRVAPPPPKREAVPEPGIRNEEYRRRYGVGEVPSPVLNFELAPSPPGADDPAWWTAHWNGWTFIVRRLMSHWRFEAKPPPGSITQSADPSIGGWAVSPEEARGALEAEAERLWIEDAATRSPLAKVRYPAFVDVASAGMHRFTTFLSRVKKNGVAATAQEMGWSTQHVLDALALGAEHYKTYQGGKHSQKTQEALDVLAAVGAAPVPPPVPAKTLAEAKDQAARLFPGRDVDLDSWQVGAANDFNATLDKLIREYPEVGKTLSILGSSTYARTILPIRGRQPKSYAWALQGNEGFGSRPGIILQDSKGRDYSGSLRKLSVDVANAFHPTGFDGSFEAILTHEFGHHVHWALAARPELLQELQDQLDQAVLDWYAQRGETFPSLDSPQFKYARAKLYRQVSQYATESGNEFFAEAWADWKMNGDRAHFLSQIIGRFTDLYFRAGVMPT